ncbi:MAG: DUF4180 domain-containing protein [Oscillospiraceae bacterium]|nr:DUF4180 domain-containing protein [Oscillospiraceae bacterium]
MAFKMLTNNVAHVQSDSGKPILHNTQSALDLISSAWYEGDVTRLVISKKDVCEDFFNPQTGIADDMLRRFCDYGFRIAIVGDFSTYANQKVLDFIRESNKGRVLRFADSFDTAIGLLSS